MNNRIILIIIIDNQILIRITLQIINLISIDIALCRPIALTIELRIVYKGCTYIRN